MPCSKKENLGLVRCILVFVVLVQLVGGVAVVFYLSYSSATNAAESIFSNLMTGLIERSRSDLDGFFKPAMRMLRQLQATMRYRLTQIPDWHNGALFNASQQAGLYSLYSFWLNQGSSSVVSMGFASPRGAAFGLRDPGQPTTFAVLDGSGTGAIDYYRFTSYGKHEWDNVTEDIPLETPLRQFIDEGKAYLNSRVEFFNFTDRPWYQTVNIATAFVLVFVQPAHSFVLSGTLRVVT